MANGDVDAVAWDLRRLMADENLRRATGAAVLRNATRYDPAQVAAGYVELFEDAARRRAARAKGYRAPAGPGKTAAALTAVPSGLLGAATVDVAADDAGRLRFATDGPAEARHRRQFLLRP